MRPLTPTLVTPARNDIERNEVITAWSRRGWPVRRLERFWEPPELDHRDVRLYGDMVFCLFLAERLHLELISPPDDLLLQIDARWLGRRITGAVLGDAAALPYPVFVKSLAPKAFRAVVYDDMAQLERETAGLAQDTPIILSAPVTFTSEARCLVRQGAVVSASLYEGDADVNAARAFADQFIAANSVAITYILDVGWLEGHGWAVIEANAVWGGGLNGCDADQMADCLALAARPVLMGKEERRRDEA